VVHSVAPNSSGSFATFTTMRLIEGEHLRYLCLLLCVPRVDIDERLSVSVQHLEAAVDLLDLPRWWETA
jgi:hypothetical protein